MPPPFSSIPFSSIRSHSYRGEEDSTSSHSSVHHPTYRQDNLRTNGIEVRNSRSQLPGRVSSHVDQVRAARESPDLPSDQLNGYLNKLDVLAEGCREADVEEFLKDTIFPKDADPSLGRVSGLESATSAPISPHLVPSNPESPFRISQPKPDLLYGYSGELQNGAFTPSQFLSQSYLDPQNPRFPQATEHGLRFPFLAVEFKAPGGTRGDLWVATNECAGASSACLNAIEPLNALLGEHQSTHHVDNLAYCVAVDSNVAQLYVSWKEDSSNYCLQRVDDFLLSRPEEFTRFRRQVRNILHWGKDTRLNQIRSVLDLVLEEFRRDTAKRAKARQPPSHGSAASSSKKSKIGRQKVADLTENEKRTGPDFLRTKRNREGSTTMK